MKGETTTSNSLLPYLILGGNRFYLHLPLTARDLSDVSRLYIPFPTISDSHPLYRVYEAQLLTDANSRVKRVFLLVQKDVYVLPRNDMWPLNNRDIDDFWQTTFSYFTTQEAGSIVLSTQITQKKLLNPLHPLLFCVKKQVFFHLLCLRCGLILRQCYDDNLLVGLGLKPYSTSLQRYLYCPSCLKSGDGRDFYVYQGESLDPDLVKDRRDLVQQYGQLPPNAKHAGQIPCLQCPEKAKCYGSANEVHESIVPFSFFPFYMIMLEAMSLQAHDFLALLAGASFEELEVQLANKGELGRLSYLRDLRKDRTLEPRLLFSDDERDFLEVLYLKLSFLVELARIIFSGTFIDKRPDLGISIDQIWIKLGDQGRLLPSFWNFGVSPVGIVTKPLNGVAFPNLPSSYGLYILGLCWLNSLLVNSKQDTSQVYRALGHALEKGFADEPSGLTKALMDDSSLSFIPENIFWNPALRTVHQSHHPLWEKTLSLGCSLLRASNSMGPDWSKDEFLRQVEDLREGIKDKLFQAEPVSVRQTAQSENEAITNILERIKHKWLAEVQRTPSELPDSVAPLPDDLRAETQPLDAPAVNRGEFIPETVMLSPEEAAREMAKQPTAPRAPGPDTKTEEYPPPETVQLAEGLPIELQAKDEEELILETVMLSPTEVSGQSAAPAPDLSGDETAPAEDQAKRRKKKIKDSPGDDFVVKTVFLSPEEVQDEGQEDADE